ncbi:MAG TPA: hypothetical protein VFX64_06440 [Candidatus Nitrosotalea sp.]|nr:hypothetical protein [Candidatus Nitrosotalea sp.]
MKTLYILSIFAISAVFGWQGFVIITGLGLVENAFAASQNPISKYVLTFNKKEYPIYYNATNTTVDKISIDHTDRGTPNPILLNLTTGKYASLTLFIPGDLADSYLIGSQCSPNNAGNLVVLEDGTEILPVVNFTNNFLKITMNPLPTDTKSIEIFEMVIGGPGPMSSLFGIPDSIKANPGQQVHLEGTVEDLCGRPEIFNNTINLNFTSQISIKNHTVTTNDSKFTLDFIIPKNTKLGMYDALFSWQFYERQPLHIFVENESAVQMQNFTVTKIIDINTLAKLEGDNLYDNDHYSSIGFYALDWSPDGKFLYALVDFAPDYGIWKINTENNDMEKIKLPYKIEGYPYEVLKVHDNKILFVTTGKYSPVGGSLHIYKYDIENNSLVNNVITSPNPLAARAFTNNGDLVYEEDIGARVSSNYNTTLWLADSDGKKIKTLYTGLPKFFSVSSSADNQKLVFRSFDSNLQTFDMRSGKFKTISNSMSYSDWPSWSPNSKFVTYTNNGLGGGSMILSTPDDNVTQVVYTNAYQIQHPSVSPDGRSIAFAINYDNSGRSISVSGIYVVKLTNPIPEFPFTIPVLLIGFTSLVVFYRMKS